MYWLQFDAIMICDSVGGAFLKSQKKLHEMALPNQQIVDYPSFKLVIVGNGGTCPSLSPGFSFVPDLGFAVTNLISIDFLSCIVSFRVKLSLMETNFLFGFRPMI